MPRIRFRSERGQTAAEYAVMLGVITAGIVGALAALSTAVRDELMKVIGFLGG